MSVAGEGNLRVSFAGAVGLEAEGSLGGSLAESAIPKGELVTDGERLEGRRIVAGLGHVCFD